jgi:hypothetical protein
MDGFFDRGAPNGNPKASAPCTAAYRKRLEALGRVGTWRKGPASYKRNDGPFIDPDYYIVDW